MTQIIIPAAGSGKRLKNINPNRIPKSLIEIEERKIIDIQLSSLQDISISEFIFVTGAKNEQLEEYIKSKNLQNIRFIFNNQHDTTNCGYSLSLALTLIKEDWIYLNSDLILERAAFKLIKEYLGINSVCVNLGQRTDLHIFLSDEKKYIKEWIPIDTYVTTPEQIKNMPTPDGEIVGPIIGTKELAQKLLSKFSQLNNDEKMTISCYTLFSKIKEIKYLTIDITDFLWKEIDTEKDFNFARELIKKSKKFF